MSDRPLPRAATTTDMYLAAILEELKAQRPQPVPAAPAGLTVIQEPAPAFLGTPLPEDFPGVEALAEAGIVYLETVPRDGDALVMIPGIGKATANKILTRLS